MTEQKQKAVEQLERVSSMLGAIGETVDYTEVAINAMEEIQQYRAIGTPNQIYIRMGGYIEELSKYAAIGTPEECRAAVEKQKAKKPKEYEDKFYGCPTCGNVLLHKWEKYNTKLMDKKNGLPYCLGCGQKLDWSDGE